MSDDVEALDAAATSPARDAAHRSHSRRLESYAAPVVRILSGAPVTGEPVDPDYIQETDEFFAQRDSLDIDLF